MIRFEIIFGVIIFLSFNLNKNVIAPYIDRCTQLKLQCSFNYYLIVKHSILY